MPAVHETAYPRLKHSISNEELHESYTPSSDELALADEASKGTGPKICLLVLLKVFQRLDYFVRLRGRRAIIASKRLLFQSCGCPQRIADNLPLPIIHLKGILRFWFD